MDDIQKLAYDSYTELVLVDIWIVLTGLANLVTNCMILYGLIKSKLFRPVYIVILHISALDIIQQLFCPTVFRLFANVDDIFKDFMNHKIFTSIYFTTLFLIAILMFILLLRVHVKCLDKGFLYVLISYWVLSVCILILCFLSIRGFDHRFILLPPYFMMLGVLLIYVHVHQIRTTLKFGEYSGIDYQVSVLIVLTFVSSRLIGILFFLLGEIAYGLIPLLSDYFILGTLQLVSIGNLLIIGKFEEEFKNNIRFIFRKRRNIVDNFRPLHEDHTLPE